MVSQGVILSLPISRCVSNGVSFNDNFYTHLAHRITDFWNEKKRNLRQGYTG